MADPRLSVVITGEAEGLSAALNQAKTQIQGFASQAGNALSSLKGMFGGLAAGVAVAATAGYIKGAVQETVDWGIQAQKVSKILGVTTEEASALAVAVGDVYGDMDGFLGLISKLTTTIRSNEGAFQQLGVQTRTTTGEYRRTIDIFLDATTALSRMEAGTARNIQTQNLFGKGWQEVEKYLALTRDRLEEAREKTDALGLTMDETRVQKVEAFRAAMNEVEDKALGIKVAIGNELLPVITDFGTRMGQSNGEIQVVANSLKGLYTAAVLVGKGIQIVGISIGNQIDQMAAGIEVAKGMAPWTSTDQKLAALEAYRNRSSAGWKSWYEGLDQIFTSITDHMNTVWKPKGPDNGEAPLNGGGGGGGVLPPGPAAPARRTPFEPEKLKDQLQLLPELTNAFAGLEEANQRVQEEMADTGMSLEHLAAQGRADAAGGFAAGLSSYLEQARNGFEQFRNLALDVIYSVEYAFSDGLTRIAMGQVSLTEGLKGMWQGLSQSVVGALMKIITTKGMEWAIDKAKFAWDKMRIAFQSAATVKEVAEAGARSTAAATETGANTGAAASGIFKAHSRFPWVGVAVALGMIALMMAAMKKITARAVGGLVTKPELTLLGERVPELLAPESSFMDWAADLTAYIMASQAQAQAYQLQAGRYGQRMAEMPPQVAQPPIQINMAGAQFVGQDRRSLEQFGSLALDAIQVAAKSRGVVLRPGGGV